MKLHSSSVFALRAPGFAALALVLASLIQTPAQAAPGSGHDSSAAPLGRVCQAVVGVHPGEAHYDGCVVSLADSLTALATARGLRLAREDCLARGVAPGAALSVCMVDASRTEPRAAADATAASALAVIDRQPAAGSYFYAASGDRRRREARACALLGLEPGGEAFSSCVAGLAQTLFALDNPSN